MTAVVSMLGSVGLLTSILVQQQPIDYESARSTRRLQVVRVTGEVVVVDGQLNERAWDDAPVATDFIQNEPHPDEPASERTEVRVLYDDEFLYFGVRIHDSEVDRVIVSDLRKDFVRDSGDSFQVMLDTFGDRRNGYQFAINPAGAKWDAQVTNEGRQVNEDWDAVWFVRTHQVEGAWTAEIAIPFKTLQFSEANAQVWGLNFQRSVRRTNEQSFWSPVPRIYDVSRVSLAGTLDGLHGVRPGSNLRIKPSVVGQFNHESLVDDEWDGDFGLDVKYGITSGLSWDFTYNTDFSQVEADNQQINLTRFNVRFPEKREFFLENAGIFQFSGGADEGPNVYVPPNDMLFFHSRQIGLSGDDSPTPGTPIPIVGGTRLTGRVAGMEVGMLNIQQREHLNTPGTNFTVLRFRRNLFANSDIGLMVNNKEHIDSPHFNRVVGFDANLRFTPSTGLYSYLAKSFSPDGGGHDVAGRIFVHYLTNKWNLRSSYVNIEQDFRNEMGFVPRVGQRKYAGFVGRSYRPTRFRDSIRRIYPHWKIDYVWNPEGRLESRSIDNHFSVDMMSGAENEVGVNIFRELLLEPFVINRRQNIVIPPGLYTFHEALWMGNTNPSRRVSANARIGVGPFWSGYSRSYLVGGTVRLNYQLSTSFTYRYNNVDLREGSFDTGLFMLRADYSLSTRAFLNALIQYNKELDQWSSNIRFNVIHRPLSDFYLVYDQRPSTTSVRGLNHAVIAKLTYMIVR